MVRSTTDTSRNGAGPPPDGAVLGEQAWDGMRSAPMVAAPRRRRSAGLVALAVALMAVCGVGAVAVYQSTNDLQAAVGVAVEVPYGSVITEADLVQIQVHQDPAVRAVAWEQRTALVGQRAATDLLPGSVITADAGGGVTIPGAGESLVGVAVAPGNLPATPLGPRDPVLLIATDGPAGASTGEAGAAISGTVVLVGGSDSTGARVVDVVVPSEQAGTLAARAAAGRIAIVLQPGG